MLQSLCIQERIRSCTSAEFQTSDVSIKGIDWKWDELSNLEHVWLATIWGTEKFHYFLYGKAFTLETDQKPLVSIYKKPMVEISPLDPEIDSEKLAISAVQCCVQENSGNSTSRCTKSCYTITNEIGWNSATYHSSEFGDSKNSIQFQRLGEHMWGNTEISYNQSFDHHISTGYPCE